MLQAENWDELCWSCAIGKLRTAKLPAAMARLDYVSRWW
jgi:hypothetical protein